MPRTPSQVDQAAFYEAALEGLELQKQRLEEQIRLVRSLIGGKKTRSSAPPAPPAAAEVAPLPAAKKGARKQRRKRNLSPEARTRIAEAQRKRWAAFRKDSK